MDGLEPENTFAFLRIDQGVGEDENCNDPDGCVEFVSHLFPILCIRLAFVLRVAIITLDIGREECSHVQT